MVFDESIKANHPHFRLHHNHHHADPQTKRECSSCNEKSEIVTSFKELKFHHDRSKKEYRAFSVMVVIKANLSKRKSNSEIRYKFSIFYTKYLDKDSARIGVRNRSRALNQRK